MGYFSSPQRVLARSFLILLGLGGAAFAQRAQPRPALRAQNLGVELGPYLYWTLNVIGSPELQAFLVSEWRHGEDRNGDGDLADDVWCVFDPLRGRLRNLGLAGLANADDNLRARVAGGRLAFLVHESAQGNTDLAGDGSTNSSALHVYDLARDQVFNLHSEGPFFDFAGDVLVHTQGVPYQPVEVRVVDLGRGTSETITVGRTYRVSCSSDCVAYTLLESQAGDLNGDGDASDHVVQVYERASGTTTNLGLAMHYSDSEDRSLRVAGSTVSFLCSEAAQGVDLSGDGAADDYVPCAYRAESDTLLVFAFDSYPVPMNGIAASSYGLWSPELMTFPTVETTSDLNGDGDMLDNLLVLQPLTGGPALAVAASIPFAWDARAGRLALSVRELTQGAIDLNGDGDASDYVLHLYENGALTNLGLASGNKQAGRDGTLAFEVGEQGQGQTDLNGDGDLLDAVWFVRTPGGRVSNTGLSGHAAAWGPGRFRFDAYESASATDLNGDGDASDRVWVGFDARTRLQLVLETPISGLGPEAWASTLCTVDEALADLDLNGDGDTADQVVHRVGP